MTGKQWLQKSDTDKWHVIKLIYKHLDNLDGKAADSKKYISFLMDDIVSFYQQKQINDFKAQLLFIADEKLKENPIAKAILHHFDGIVNYVNSQITNGILEGLNSKIQVIKRVARDFRCKNNFKKMIRFVFEKKHYQVIA